MSLQRALASVTGWGWALVGFALVGTALGVAGGWREFIVLGVAAAVLVVCALPWVFSARSMRASLSLSTPRVGVGGAAWAVLQVHRPGRVQAPRSVEITVGRERMRVELPPLARNERSEVRIRLDTDSRGRLDIGPVSLVRTDPFGILEREQRLTGSLTLIVHPRTVRIPGIASGLVRDLEGEAAAELTADDVAFHSLREYLPGDERKHVHWRSSVRHGTLLVKQFEPSRRSDTLVCFSTLAADYAAEEFELTLSLVATIGAAAIQDRRKLRVVESPQSKERAAADLRVPTRDALLDALTDLADDRSLGIVDTVLSVSSSPQASIAWLIVGSRVPARELRQAASKFPPDVVPVIVRARAGSAPSVTQLGRVSVVTVGALEDLGRGLGIGALA